MKRQNRLTLNRETLRNLNLESLKRAGGGESETYSCGSTCGLTRNCPPTTSCGGSCALTCGTCNTEFC